MKLLASDYDGTLLLHPHKNDSIILAGDKEAISRFQKAGNIFGICTGRGLDGVVKWCEDIVFDFYIINSGALILNKDKKIIQANYLEKQLIEDILAAFDSHICATFVYDGKMYVMNPNKDYPSHIQTVTSLHDFGHYFEAFSLHFEDDIEMATKIKDEIIGQFGKQIAVYQNIDNIDMCAKGCSKGNGIKTIQQYYGLSDEDMHVIGDSWNDIPMFEVCENAFTFYHSPEDVQAKTKYQVDTIEMCIDQIMSKPE